jgi:transcriptional regulator with XRE-family HTH domain
MAKHAQTFTEQIRLLIETSGQTAYEISKATGIDKAALSRFLNGKSGLTTASLDLLAEHFGWEIVATKKVKRRKGR